MREALTHGELMRARRVDVLRFARWLGVYDPKLLWCSSSDRADAVLRALAATRPVRNGAVVTKVDHRRRGLVTVEARDWIQPKPIRLMTAEEAREVARAQRPQPCAFCDRGAIRDRYIHDAEQGFPVLRAVCDRHDPIAPPLQWSR